MSSQNSKLMKTAQLHIDVIVEDNKQIFSFFSEFEIKQNSIPLGSMGEFFNRAEIMFPFHNHHVSMIFNYSGSGGIFKFLSWYTTSIATFKSSHGCLIFYDLGNKKSLKIIEQCLEKLHRIKDLERKYQTPIVRNNFQVVFIEFSTNSHKKSGKEDNFFKKIDELIEKYLQNDYQILSYTGDYNTKELCESILTTLIDKTGFDEIPVNIISKQQWNRKLPFHK